MPSPSLTPLTVIARAPAVIDVSVAGSLVVHDPVGDRYLRLNRTAAAVWERLSRPSSLADLADTLVAKYGLEPDRAAHDAEGLVAALIVREIACVVSEDDQTGNEKSPD